MAEFPEQSGVEYSSKKIVRILKSFGQEAICLNLMNREFCVVERCIDPMKAIHRVIHRFLDTINLCGYFQSCCNHLWAHNLQQ